MGLWIVRGGNRLYSTVTVQGSVDAALPILAAALLHDGITVLENVPRVGDVAAALQLLRCLHCQVLQEGDKVTVDSRGAAPEELSAAAPIGQRLCMLFLGAMIGRFGAGCVPMPKTCVLGPRPMDMHFAILEKLGAVLSLSEDKICCTGAALQGDEIRLAYPGVGVTEQSMLTACGCSGETVLRNCAIAPEVDQLAGYLRACGHTVVGEGTETIRICPGKTGGSIRWRLMPDRIAASILLCAVAACGGKLTLQEVICLHLHPILDVLEEMGCNIKIRDSALTLQSDGNLWAAGHEIVTGMYPSFPTAVQPAFLAACLRADGVTVLRERVFGGALSHGRQLRRFGGNVALAEDCTAVVTGVSRLNGAHVRVRDVQGGTALLIAALQAPEESRIVDDGCLSRKYAFLDAVLRQMGADLEFSE